MTPHPQQKKKKESWLHEGKTHWECPEGFNCDTCSHFTGCTTYPSCRKHPTPAAPEKEVLNLLKKKIAWGKEIDKNHLFDYHAIEQMIEEVEYRVYSLRTQEHERGDQR